jgi:adenine-specific DNA-methyltransferase
VTDNRGMPANLGPSHDAEEDALQRLAVAFPETITDGKVDLERLKQALGEHVETGRERYGLTWPGKAESIKAAQRPSLGTLRPKAGEGINEDSTGNLIIEGDNLEVLKLLQKAYLGKIKMIYIDPPYNTGNDFVYEDNFADPLAGYLEQTGQTVDGKRLSTNTETAGRYHSNWLSMMYPRLTLARNLLREDGVIFISIDDNEVANLRKICDEVFGEENFVGTFKWNRTAKAPSLSRSIRVKYEYVLCFKNLLTLDLFGKSSYNTQAPLLNSSNRQVELVFPPNSIRVPHSFHRGSHSDKFQVELLDDLHETSGLNENQVRIRGCFSWSQKKVDSYLSDLGLTFLVKKSLATIYYDMSNDGTNFIAPSDLISPEECGVKRNADAKAELDAMGIPFDYSKPVSLIQYLIKTACEQDPSALILDFFAGSGTTAQAVLEMNEEDGGNRKFILVQLPEVVDEDSAAAKAGFANIVEITKERVRRVIKKLDGGTTEGLGLDGTKNLDRGFKVYALDRSNFVPWDATAATDAASLEKQLELAVDNVVHGRSHADLLAEILLKTGFPLDTPITKVTIAGTNVYQVADPGFLVCLADTVDAPLIKAIAATKPHRVVILDAAFQGNDALKTNAVQAFKDQGVEMFRTA